MGLNSGDLQREQTVPSRRKLGTPVLFLKNRTRIEHMIYIFNVAFSVLRIYIPL